LPITTPVRKLNKEKAVIKSRFVYNRQLPGQIKKPPQEIEAAHFIQADPGNHRAKK
jgi:hypothetical protein